MDSKENQFDSEFGNVKYIVKDNIVLLTWKKFCCNDDYRKPATFALELLNGFQGSNLIVDARNGFEDEEEDVEWGLSFLLPAMSRTSCKKVVFIMNKVNDIEEEMDMWTREFRKYFTVSKAESLEAAIKTIKG